MQQTTDTPGTVRADGDPAANAVYCRITKNAVFKSLAAEFSTFPQLNDHVIVDIDAAGEIVGVELLGVRNPGGRWEVTRR